MKAYCQKLDDSTLASQVANKAFLFLNASKAHGLTSPVIYTNYFVVEIHSVIGAERMAAS
ncbi:hypothetical protein [Gelidibacter sp.]|uniref:hypothetical protein n=1 Tax=Gelidibacter sp. TaxID=2018083 RepID=UPI002BDABDEC|nr:hypothetical protein [Gelidibacter sp.]HUH28462.1 hypothetical protein [Gelidibacter sp.]